MADTPNPFDWKSLIQPGVGAGAQLLGQTLANKSNQAVSREQLAQQQRQFNITQGNKQAEIDRRNQLFGIAAPGMFRNLGYNPEQIPGLVSKVNQPEVLGAGNSGYGSGYPGATMQPSKVSSVLGGVGTGLGMAGLVGKIAPQALSKLGLSALGGPVGLAAGGALTLGSILANKIGQGRRTANVLTGEGGIQRNFESRLKEIDGMGLPPDQAWGLKRQAYDELVNQGRQFATSGGKQALVARQMFDQIDPYFGVTENPLGVR